MSAFNDSLAIEALAEEIGLPLEVVRAYATPHGLQAVEGDLLSILSSPEESAHQKAPESRVRI